MSAVQFNLLPDVKLAYDKAERTKRLVISVAVLSAAAVAALFIISFVSVNVLQKKLLNDANGDITKYSNQLKGIDNLEQILTIQNQLNSLPSLHQSKHVVSRLFAYLPQITPANASIGKLDLDTSANTISIDGTADTVETVNKFIDTIKFTTYKVSGGQSLPAFSNVILTAVDRNDKNATYTIDANFDPALFTAGQNVTLTVPTEVTTRSVLNAPSISGPLFNGQTEKTINGTSTSPSTTTNSTTSGTSSQSGGQ